MLAYFRPPRLRRSIRAFLCDRHGHFVVGGDNITYTAENLNFPAALRLKRHNYIGHESMEIEIHGRTGFYKATIFPTSYGLGVSYEGVLKVGKKGYEMKSSQEKHQKRMLENAAFILDLPELREDLQKALKDGVVKDVWFGPKTAKYLKLEGLKPEE